MSHSAHNEAFSRVRIDALLRAQGWEIENTNHVRYEYMLPDKTKADYVLCDRHGRSLAVLEAKRFSIEPIEATKQAADYAAQLGVPYVFLSNGKEILFWEWQTEAFPRPVKTFFNQDDLERRAATRSVRRDLLSTKIDEKIAGRDYQIACIEALSIELVQGRRKMLVEMATGTGKTRTAAAFIKRLFEANAVTRVLFLVDRITLAKQTEDAFAEALPDYPAYVLRTGRRFQDEKRITITTLQSMVNIYGDYSAGYFDLVISDECHRSIYGKWSGVLRHFDGIQLGLTATPCVAGELADAPDIEDEAFVRDTLRFFEVEQPSFTYRLRQAINEGYLVPYQIYKARTVRTAAEGGFEVKRNEIDWSSLDAESVAEFHELFAGRDTLTVDPSALERRFTIPERNRAIVREFRSVLDNGFVDHKRQLRKPLIGKTIVFAVNKRHAETLAQMFDAEFAHLKTSPDVRYADFVVSGMGADDTVDAAAKIKRFKRETFPQILVSVNMLDTGFDCPQVVNLVFARFTRSTILYQQMRGRGTRKARGKPTFTMFDFVGVCDYHGDDDAVAEGGVVIARQPRPGPIQPRRLLSLDINDHIDPTTREWITTDDDGNLVFPQASVEKAAAIGAKFEAWLLALAQLTPEQEQWLRKVGSQLRANAESQTEFSSAHFAFAPFSLMGGTPEAQRVFGGEDALEQLLADLNGALFREPGVANENSSRTNAAPPPPPASQH